MSSLPPKNPWVFGDSKSPPAHLRGNGCRYLWTTGQVGKVARYLCCPIKPSKGLKGRTVYLPWKPQKNQASVGRYTILGCYGLGFSLVMTSHELLPWENEHSTEKVLPPNLWKEWNIYFRKLTCPGSQTGCEDDFPFPKGGKRFVVSWMVIRIH